jgi:hypothetical protein
MRFESADATREAAGSEIAALRETLQAKRADEGARARRPTNCAANRQRGGAARLAATR